MNEHTCECQQCNERRAVEILGLCRPCYDAAVALGFTDAEIEERVPEECAK